MIKKQILNSSLKLALSLTMLCHFGCNAQAQILSPDNLLVSEGFKNPIGFYDNKPTFSWNLPISKEVKSQTAYQIIVASKAENLAGNPDLWDSGKQGSNQSNWIKYQGKNLSSRQKVYWQVRYWNQDNKVSKWSAINTIEYGLLSNSDWKAKWIGLPTKEENVLGSKKNIIHRPQYLRKEFELSNNVTSARLYITAKGVFDVAINGKDVSNDVMPPGWTAYSKRIETITYDVTQLLKSGKNTIGVEVAAGWHSGRLGWSESFWKDTESPKIVCQIELLMKDGSTKTIVSDESWKATTNGPIRTSEIYDGETYDANFEMPNWATNGFNDKDWRSVNVFPVADSIRLEPKRHSNVKPKFEIKTKEIIERGKTAIFDLQQNMVGVVSVEVPMKKGDTLKVRFAEMLAPDGSFYTKNYRSAQSTDYYIAAKDGLVKWSPKFTFHGFRYVELSGYNQEIKPSKNWVTGIVQYSDFEENGTFVTSHEKLNKLQSNIVWGLRGNFFDIPTDCPQRDERLGWTGDAQVFGPTSLFNADVYQFWASWLQSVRESQYKNGGIPFVVPDVLKNGKVSSGWGDVSVIIPWKMYYRTGDTSVLEENYEMMKAWVKHHEDSAKDYISNMNTYADWLQPFPKNGDRKGDTSNELISTAFFAHAANLTAKTAQVLGKKEDQMKYNNLYKSVANAFENKFFDESGKVKEVTSTQTSYLLAIAFDLLSDSKKQNAQKQLLEEIKKADNHLRTGFLGTPLLSEVLDEMGEVDLIYKILFNETYPSWFYSINQGATTIWERWNSYSKTEGFNPENMNSLNHYAYGAIGEWMYERIAGIAPLEVGYKKIRIAPVVKAPLTSASGSLLTPYGKVVSSWKIENNTFQLNITIPPNTTATVVIPANVNEDLLLEGKIFKNNSDITMIKKGTNTFELSVKPGTYKLISKM